MKSRERVKLTLNHKELDRVPIDFGSTAVTGISASVVSKLRNYYGLSNDPPVKVIDPYQMLGKIADDLKEIMGVDCVGLQNKKNIFGFENTGWKEWELFDGTLVLVPEKFNTVNQKDGSIYQYPEGDTTNNPSARMPKGGYYFDSLNRQQPIDDNSLDVNDNLEEFKLIKEGELDYLRKETDYLYNNTDYAIISSFSGTALGDIALVPAPFLKNPKGIRDVQEWYISLATRKSYIFKVFEKQCEIALEN